jgi:aryl-alcohol dehydrogenase-like predicted oxidoreductase
MQKVRLGTTDLVVSKLALGCMSLTQNKESQSIATVQRAIELGVNFFDTADVYGQGQSEIILGKALKISGIPRDQIVIASKCGIVFKGMNHDYKYKAYDLSRDYIRASCEASLKRLGVETIDLYQPHRIDYLTHPEETASALEDLRKAGKIRHVGVSNYTVGEIRALSAYLRIECLQTRFSLLHLEPLESGLASICLEKNMNVLAYSPLHRGVLAGGRQLDHHDWQQQREAGVITQLQPFAEQYGMTTGQLALAWMMQLPGGVIPIVGTANPVHIADATAAVGTTLDRDDWYELMVIARGRPMPWSQRPFTYLKET